MKDKDLLVFAYEGYNAAECRVLLPPPYPLPPLKEGGGGVAKRTKAVCSKLFALTSWGVLINGAAPDKSG